MQNIFLLRKCDKKKTKTKYKQKNIYFSHENFILKYFYDFFVYKIFYAKCS